MPTLHLWSDLDLRAICVRPTGSRSWVEFRSDHPYHDQRWEVSDAALLHNTLEGWHACVLHAGASLDLLPRHPDYPQVAAMLEDTR